MSIIPFLDDGQEPLALDTHMNEDRYRPHCD